MIPLDHWLTLGLQVGGELVGFAILARVVRYALVRLEERAAPSEALRARRATVWRLLRSAVRYTIDFVAVVAVMETLGVRATSLLAGAGVVGLAVSFGAQGLVQDMVTGIFLLYENQFVVGEEVSLPALGLAGTVEEVGLRITRLKGPKGEEIVVPNRLILQVQNYSRGRAMVSVGVTTALKWDPEAVEAVLQEFLAPLRQRWPDLQVEAAAGAQPGQVTWSITGSVDSREKAECERAVRRAAVRALYYLEQLPSPREKERGDGTPAL